MLHAAARHSYSNHSTALRPGLRHTRLKAAVVGALASMSNYTPARPPIVVKPTAPHNSTVIWLHGLGDTGAGWADAASSFASALPGTKFVFPTAAVRPVTLNGGMAMTSWFDITSLSDIDHKEDAKGVAESAAYAKSLIAAEVAAGIPHKRIVLAGFSQGGAVALHVGMRSPEALGGVMALSTWLPLAGDYPAALGAGAKDTPVEVYHGTMDPVVRNEYGKRSYEKVKQLGVAAGWHTYPMQHSACPDELNDIKAFLLARLG